MADDILDPAHADDGGVENAGAAGLARPDNTNNEPEERLSDDGNILERKGKKYVTIEALHAERETNRQTREALASLDPLMPDFQEFLKTKNNRRTATRQTVANSGEQDTPEYLDEVATALGFYDENNALDRRRAQAHLTIMRRESQRVSESVVRPVHETTVRDRADVNRQRVRGAKFLDGQPIASPQYIDAALQALGDEYLADTNIANILQVVAAGLEYLDKRRNGTLRANTRRGANTREPMYLEAGSGRIAGEDGELTPLDLAAARARGKTPEQWKALKKRGDNKRDDSVLEEV